MHFAGHLFLFVLAIVNAMSEKYRLEKLQKLLKKVIFKRLWRDQQPIFADNHFKRHLGGGGGQFRLALAKIFSRKFYPGGRLIWPPIPQQMAAGGAIFLKNGVGFIGMFVIIWVAFLPGIKILLAGWGMKLVAALIEPLGEKMLCEMFQNVGECVILLFGRWR